MTEPTAIGNAMVRAGLVANAKPTQMELVWRWIKDHPRHSPSQIKAGLKNAMPESSVYQSLTVLVARKMCNAESDFDKTLQRKVYRYTSLIDEYEMLPYPRGQAPWEKKAAERAALKKAQEERKARIKREDQLGVAQTKPHDAVDPGVFDDDIPPNAPRINGVPVAGLPMVKALGQTPEQKAEAICQDLSVIEARALLNKLRELFGL